MLRFREIKDAKAAESYFGKSDGNYYVQGSDLHREVGGNGAKMLGLSEQPDFEQFSRLLRGLDPNSGEQLTAKLVDNRVVARDVTASVPKGVTIALERGDSRVHDVIWNAGRAAMADLEAYSTARVRKGGAQDDRRTGNIIWYGWEHPETRPNRDDGMPDMDRHIHFVVMNLTYDPVEKEWKAMKFRDIMDLRKYFDRRFDMYVARGMTDLGYEVETKYKADGRGDKRYFSWDIKGIPQSAVKKFSRRAGVIDMLAGELGIENPVSKDKLGATTRLHKLQDMTLADYRTYWEARITDEEKKQIAETIKAAMLGQNERPTNTVDKAVAWAVQHEFERRSVMDWHDLAITAMERCLGGATPEEIEPESRRQGVLLKNGEATTEEVLAEEGRIIAFAREGRGTMRPLGSAEGAAVPAGGKQSATLSPDQQAVCKHIWDSTDRVIMVEGDAGTGKTQTMQRTIPGIDRPGVFLAPSASASRGTLREKGFTNADTIARFLVDEKFREQARDGYIYVDEAPLAGLKDIDQVFRHAKALNARVIIQGDRKQHKSVQRGNLFGILDQYAGLKVGRLTKNWRQQGKDYKTAVNALAKGKIVEGYDMLNDLGWVKQTPAFDHNKPLVDDYLAGRDAGQSVLVVAPTHKEGDEITAAIRDRLKKDGKLGDEKVIDQLVPLGWTAAQKSDLEQYDGTEVMQYFRNSGSFKAGQQVKVTDWKPGDLLGKPEYFAVYAPRKLALAVGDSIRTTANIKDSEGRRLDNDTHLTVTGFTEKGIEVRTATNQQRTLPDNVGHLTHGYVSTSHASQGKTVDQVLIGMGHESVPAMSSEQFYVSVSRGRKAATIYTDLSPTTLREAIQRKDGRKSATELMGRRPKRKSFTQIIKERFRLLQEKARQIIPDRGREQERGSHER